VRFSLQPGTPEFLTGVEKVCGIAQEPGIRGAQLSVLSSIAAGVEKPRREQVGPNLAGDVF
jgi:hypothetical protein